MNIENAIYDASQILKKNNIKSPILDSELLMSKAIQKDRDYIILNLKNNLDDQKFSYFSE